MSYPLQVALWFCVHVAAGVVLRLFMNRHRGRH